MSRFGPGLLAAVDRQGWTWVESALGEFGTVGGLVPIGFDSYVRIDHGEDEGFGTWDLPSQIVAWIAEVGARHTSTPDLARFAVWEGYGWLNSTMLYSQAPRPRFTMRRGRVDPFRDVIDEFEAEKSDLREELAGLVKLELPQRTYFVLAGALTAVISFHDPLPPTTRRVPDLWWPSDRGWFVGSDPDLDSTYLGGSARFIAALVEAWPDHSRVVEPGDPLR